MTNREYRTIAITDGNVHTFSARSLVGFYNLDSAAQTVTGVVYDNTAASGTIAARIPALPIVSPTAQPETFPGDGVPLTSMHFTVQLTGAPTGAGVAIMFYPNDEANL